LFITNTNVFKEFFLRIDEINVRGKGKIVIEHNQKIMNQSDFEYLKLSIDLVSNLCYERN